MNMQVKRKAKLSKKVEQIQNGNIMREIEQLFT